MQLINQPQEDIILPSTFDRNIIFHFNKMHLQDSNVPMWVVKIKGQTYYTHHLESKIGFSTKENINSEHTKGSLKFKGHIEIRKNNNQITAIIL